MNNLNQSKSPPATHEVKVAGGSLEAVLPLGYICIK